MKKLALIVIAMFVAGSAFAQDWSLDQSQPQSKVRWGIKGGLNLARESVYSNYDDYESGSTGIRANVHVGVFADVWVADLVDFQPELLYSMQGGRYPYGEWMITEKVDYINLPLIFKFYSNYNRRFSLDTGLQFGYMVGAKISDGTTTVSIYDEFDSESRQLMLIKLDISMAIGLSVKLTDRVDIGWRTMIGLTKIAADQPHRNEVTQITLGYRF